MQITCKGPFTDHPHTLLHQAGYADHRGRDGVVSYVRRLTPAPYPRYHVYMEGEVSVTISLHLDQKWASYESGHAHGGDYSGPLVEQEIGRLKAVFLKNALRPREGSSLQIVEDAQRDALHQLKRSHIDLPNSSPSPKKQPSFFGRLLQHLFR